MLWIFLAQIEKMIRIIFRFLWKAKREVTSCLMWVQYACMRNAFFRRLGPGTHFYGKVRFGSVEGNIDVGKNCGIGDSVFLSASKGAFVRIGDRSSLNTGCHLVAVYGIEIGEDSHLGEYCSIRDQNHEFKDADTPISHQGYCGATIRIGRDVWIGRGVFVGPGVQIGDGAVIGANSVVTKSIPKNSISVGVPARIIGRRESQTQRTFFEDQSNF